MKLYDYCKLLVLGTICIGFLLYAAFHLWKMAGLAPALWFASLALPMAVMVVLLPWAIRVEQRQIRRRREEAGEPSQDSEADQWWRLGG
ncbi:hypothetical protein [Candidatus Laterigemmans baculatus]|uniref:hypothetical protein n=1 Tax=Candidatus Laterigemmans baculatus TaxID=2770505 RepID=UPI0013D970E0|nr:hypothetical protein [Candidatus Laterigemmans baculatus]